MRSILTLSILALALAGCGSSGGHTAPTAQVWVAPQSYAAAVAASQVPLSGPPPSPGACWSVKVEGQHVSFVQHRVDGTVTAPQGQIDALVPAKSTMWIGCVVPSGYVFADWDFQGTVGTFYSEGTSCTFTTPGTDGPGADTVITAVVAPIGNG